MSALEFITSGGMASTGGDLPNEERQTVNLVLKTFAEKVRTQALALQVPAAKLGILRAGFLFVGKDTAQYHVILAESGGGNRLQYRDLSSHGRLVLGTLAHQVRLEVGEVMGGFSFALNLPETELLPLLDRVVHEYLGSVLQADRTPDKKVNEEAVAYPEIASGIQKFKADHGSKRTAFIMMQFTQSDAHAGIVREIKAALQAHGIVGLRADDKQYMDDLFPNIRVYMHACDFGVAVFERITEDEFNPNLSLEVGYMLGLAKDVLVLKDKTLRALPTDLIGRLYREFDTRDLTTVPKEVAKWLTDKGLAGSR